MAVDVKLPELGEGVTEGELVKWLVKPGDSVKPDQPIAEVMTDKATVEVPTPVAGVVKDLKFKVGEMIAVEKVLLTLDGTSATNVTSASAPAAHTAAASASRPAPTSATPRSTTGVQSNVPSNLHMAATANSPTIYPPVADSKVLATPSTRRLAREMGVDINQVPGSGLAGRVTREDVVTSNGSGASAGTGASGGMDTYSTKAPFKMPAPAYNGPGGASEERVPLIGIRRKIAENLQMAKHIIPHFTLMDEAEVTELVQMRESLKDFAEKSGVKVTYLPFVMKALISTIRSFPMFNASIDDNAKEIVYKKYFNLGFAADTPNGLVVPVIKNADQKSILEISQEIVELSKKAREGKLKSEDMKGATITVTNIGSVGGTYATPIINHPEVAILGMYKITDKLFLKPDGSVGSAKQMNFTITADHRLIDGAVAANFLKAFIQKIQKPGHLMMDLR